jgi:beta-glucosidase
MGAVSTVLLKNNNHTLPLTWKPRSIALIGSDAGPPFNGPNGYSDRGGVSGTLAMGWGTLLLNVYYWADHSYDT